MKTIINEPESKPVVDYPFGIFNIELTNKCLMRCVMCPRTTNMTRSQGDMDFDVFKKAINELAETNPEYVEKKHPVWFHHFGESLLHPEFGKLLRYAADKGICSGLSVNPIMLKDDIAIELMQSGLDMLYISFDGHDEESFYKIRGLKNTYSQSYSNLLNFLDIKKKMNSNIKVTLSMIDFGLNSESIQKTRLQWESMEGIDQFLLKNFSTWDGSASSINNLSKENKNFQPQDQSEHVVCAFPWERMTIMWDGSVVPCCNDYDKKLVLGNIKSQSLSAIWNGKKMQALRHEFISNNVTNRLCRNCEKLRLPRHLWRW